MKDHILNELNNGIYKEYFAIAIKTGELNSFEFREIVECIEKEENDLFHKTKHIAQICKELIVPTVERDYTFIKENDIIWSDRIKLYRINDKGI